MQIYEMSPREYIAYRISQRRAKETKKNGKSKKPGTFDKDVEARIEECIAQMSLSSIEAKHAEIIAGRSHTDRNHHVVNYYHVLGRVADIMIERVKKSRTEEWVLPPAQLILADMERINKITRGIGEISASGSAEMCWSRRK